jgi:hypothetical protein
MAVASVNSPSSATPRRDLMASSGDGARSAKAQNGDKAPGGVPG